MTPPWLQAEVWRPVCPPLTSGTTYRSPDITRRVVEQFRVDEVERYAPAERDTRCNLYLCDVTAALGCPVPAVWRHGGVATAADGKAWPVYREQRANHLVDWLDSAHGSASGWRQCRDLAEAQARIDLGLPVVVGWHSGSDAPGHVAVGIPSPGESGLRISQAGRSCFVRGTLTEGFGSLLVRTWTHA